MMTSKMVRFSVFLSLLLIIRTDLQAQTTGFDCGGHVMEFKADTSCKPASGGTFFSKYLPKEYYAPVDGSVKGLYNHKKIKLAVKVFREIAGPKKNYAEADEYMIRNFIDRANYYLTNVPAPSDPLTIDGRNPHVSDSRFYLELSEPIDFSSSWDISGEDLFANGVPSGAFYKQDQVLNIFLIFSKEEKDSIPGGKAFNGATSGDLISGVTEKGAAYICLKNFYKNSAIRGNDDQCAAFLLHELGHLLGLNHTYCKGWGVVAPGKDCTAEPESGIEGYFDDLTDVFGKSGTTAGRIFPRPADCNTYPGTNPFYNPAVSSTANDQYTNNFMGGHSDGHYMSPMQLGRMHRNAHFTTMRKYIYPLFPESRRHDRAGQGQYYPHVIADTQDWDFDIKMYSDIVVRPGARLTVRCRVAMPYMSNIIVEPGGELILDGGKITADRNDTGYFWYGISVWGNAVQPQVASLQGTVRVIHGGTIEHSVSGIVAGDEVFGSTKRYGGIIISDGGHFINNRRSITLASYHYRYPFSSAKVPSRCSVRSSSFSWNDDYHLGSYVRDRIPDNGLSLSEVDMVNVQNCTFENNMSAAKSGSLGGPAAGLLSWSASYNVSGSAFTNLAAGVRAEGVRSEPVSAYSCNFNHCGYGVVVNGTVGVKVENNQFNTYAFAPYASVNNTGVLMYGANVFDVGHNNFFRALPDGTTTGPGMSANGYGVRIEQCSAGNNSVHHNSFSGMNVHCMSNGKNTNGRKALESDNTGLQFRCNLFDKTAGFEHTADILVLGSNPVTDGIRTIQGSSGFPAGNEFSQHLLSTELHISLKEAGIPVKVLPIDKYYYSTTEPGRQEPTYYSSGLVTPVAVAVSPACDVKVMGGATTESTVGGAASTTTLSRLAHALTDTGAQRLSLVVNAYNDMKSPYAMAELSFFYLGEGMMQQAHSSYASIFTSKEWTLDSTELSEFGMGATLLRLLTAHIVDSIPQYQLSPTEIDSLHYLTANAQTWPRAKACSWLHFATGERCFPDESPVIENDTHNQETGGLYIAEKGTESAFSVLPNPVGSRFSVTYSLSETGRLLVNDAYGRIVLDQELNPSVSKLSVYSELWTPGMYFYRVTQGQKVIHQGKLSKL